MDAKQAEIARRERSLYVRNFTLWLGLLIVLGITLAVLAAHYPEPVELLFTHGEYVTVPVLLLITVLVTTTALSRETSEGFEGVFHALPVRNTALYWGKVRGTSVLIAVFLIAFALMVPGAWIVSGAGWTGAAGSAALMHVAQVVSSILLAVGIAAFLRGAVPDFRVRVALGVAVVVALVLSPRFVGLRWGSIIAPFVAGMYGHSALFGLFPWTAAVAWKLLVQLGLSFTLLALGSLLYERRRDPAQRTPRRFVVVVLCISTTVLFASCYLGYWHDIEGALARQVALDAQSHAPVGVVASEGSPEVSHYDLLVEWSGGHDLRVVATVGLHRARGGPIPLTLHHQWEVVSLSGEGVSAWRHEGNTLWIEAQEDLADLDITVEYVGSPLIWYRSVPYMIPIHFMGGEGGLLSPLMAWYPLPGERPLLLGTPSQPQLNREPLLESPVPFRLEWRGPGEFTLASSLTLVQEQQEPAKGRVYAGVADGVALLVGRMDRVAEARLTVVGAPSVVHGAAALAEPYTALVTFYEELLGRTVPSPSVVTVPNWIGRSYGTYRLVVGPVTGESSLTLNMPLFGSQIAITESDLVHAAQQARAWDGTRDGERFMAATERLHDGLRQLIWGRPYGHRPFTESPVARGLAEFSRLAWIRFVLGDDAYELALSAAEREMDRPKMASARVSDQVLRALVDLEGSHGPEAVRQVLGLAYDHMSRSELDFVHFEQLLAAAMMDEPFALDPTS